MEATEPITIPIKLSKETKNTYRYDAVEEDAAVSNLYIQKTALPGGAPPELEINHQFPVRMQQQVGKLKRGGRPGEGWEQLLLLPLWASRPAKSRQLPPPLVWEQDSRLATCQIFRVNLRFQGPQITQHFVQSIGEHVDIRGGVFETDRPRLETGT